MKILITGANGFVGKNLVAELKNQGYTDLFLCNRSTTLVELQKYTQEAEFVYHLAGVNRPKNEKEFESGNVEFTEKLLKFLANNSKPPKLMFASSTQANLPNSYGKSKKNAESLVREYGYSNNVDVMIFQFPNLFGKWCKPNYNSVIATFCHNISREIPLRIDDSNIKLSLAYIDDVLNELIGLLDSANISKADYYQVNPIYEKSLGEIVDLLTSFKEYRINLSVPKLDNPFEKKMYSTYLSYLPDNDFSYELKMNEDHRGSFTEFLRTPERGQVSVNISKPGVKKGEHWHHTKNEKFVVVSGKGVIRFRKVDSEKVIEYFVSGEKLEVVDIPVGYTHNIENIGDVDLVTLMWVNEPFDFEKPDTYFMEV